MSGNGYIEGTELDAFLKEFVGSVTAAESGPEVGDKIYCFTIWNNY